MDQQTHDYVVISIIWLILLLIIGWISKCIVIVKEGRQKNVETFGRFSHTIAGVEGMVVDENGNLVEGITPWPFNYIRFIFYPIQKIPSYQLGLVEAMDIPTGYPKGKKTIFFGET